MGARARALLVCEVDLDKVAERESEQQGAAAGGSTLPAAYVLVERPDAIRLLHVLVFNDAHAPASSQRLSGLTLLVAGVWVAAMVLHWALAHKAQIKAAWRVLAQGWS